MPPAPPPPPPPRSYAPDYYVSFLWYVTHKVDANHKGEQPLYRRVESQKGITAVQRRSIENQKGAIAVQSLWQ